ncbi:restriction endonuclease subunit S [Metamycoplasma hyosynoviae]|uniref:restriction endonuclease subunit S n=1 Tax=Metamycoplasma hyosynoviae TaxID=29559 RepID=UPI0030823C99
MWKNKTFFRLKITYAWELYTLGDLIVKGGSGGTPLTSNPSFYNGKIPFLTIADITNSNGSIIDTEKHISKEGLASSAAWIVPKEAISLAMYASVGKVAILKENIATSQAFYNMVFEKLCTRDCVFHHLKKMEINDEWLPYISTGTQANLNAEKVRNLKIRLSNDEKEQQKIGNFFKNLDKIIDLHQRKSVL